MNNEKIKKWIKENLVMREEAAEITGQSKPAFAQSLATGRITHFVEFGSKRTTKLYLRSEMEEYARTKKEKN